MQTKGYDKEYQELYTEYFPTLLQYTRRKLQNCTEMYNCAEEYVHEIFLRLYTQWHKPAIRRNAKQWTMTALNNYLIDEWRRLYARNRLMGKPIGMENVEYLQAKTRNVRKEEPCSKMFELQDMLDRELSEEEYLLFSLRYLSRRSNSEIAWRIGRTLPMTTKKIWKLKKKLSRLLKEEM